jgi:hypothetical protein
MNAYQEAHIAKVKEQLQVINYSAWFQGQYTMMSIGAIFGKHVKYPQKPFELGKKEPAISQEEKFKLWIAEFNRRFEEKQGLGVS